MDLRRMRPADWLAGLGGVAVLAALFLPWYGQPHASGWESFAALDVILAGLALVGVVLALAALTQGTTAVPIAFAAFSIIAGLVATLLVVIRLVNLPGDAESREIGPYIALAGSLAVFLGGYWASRDERITGDTRTVDPEDVRTVPAPRP
jgi:hypothetical protein